MKGLRLFCALLVALVVDALVMIERCIKKRGGR